MKISLNHLENKYIGLFIITIFISIFTVFPITALEEKEFVGSETCIECHIETHAPLVKGYNKTLHSKVLKEKEKNSKKNHGCESCHGPGSLHVNEPDKKGSIINVKKLEPKQRAKVCLKCHFNGEQKQNWHFSKHQQFDTDCIACHQPHNGNNEYMLKFKSKNELCFSCHKDQKHKFRLTSHHPVLEKQLNCTDCHNPHGTDNNAQLKEEENDLCIKCHSNYAGPFVVEHVTSEFGQGCLSCHDSHGAPNRRLLKLTERGTCLQCHSNMITHNTGQNCLTCHPYIHGSSSDGPIPFNKP